MHPEPVTVGELFPADDLVAQWVFSLSAVAEDLSITEAAFQEVLHGNRGALWTGYHFRQVIARLYEAERPIVSAHQREDVKRFLASVPDAADHLDFLIGYYVPPAGEASRVRTAFGGIRHRTVHHSWIGSRELQDALRTARNEEARILVNRKEQWLHHEWPEAVALRALLGDLDDRDARAAFVEQTKLAQEIPSAPGRSREPDPRRARPPARRRSSSSHPRCFDHDGGFPVGLNRRTP